jgi:hypothetical protein
MKKVSYKGADIFVLQIGIQFRVYFDWIDGVPGVANAHII